MNSTWRSCYRTSDWRYGIWRRPKDAEQSLLDALDAFREWERQNPGKASSEIATTLNTLGVLYTGLERPVDAEPALLEALKMRRVLTQKNPSAAPLVAGTLNNLGILYRKMGASVEGPRTRTRKLSACGGA